MNKVGFIGMGNMASALAKAISKTGASIIASNRSNDKLHKACTSLKMKQATNIEVASDSEYVFLGVKPQIYPSVLEEIKEVLSERKDDYKVVSMAAGVTIDTIKEYLGKDTKVIRIMPNLPVGLEEGVVLIAYDDLASVEDKEEFKSLLRKSGTLLEVPENKIDAGSTISGCGPAFMYILMDAMIDGGISLGLTAKEARTLAAQTLIGAGKTVLSKDKALSELKNEVCSPNGTTIEGVKALEENGFRNSMIKAIEAVNRRSKELAKK
ncbi:MAG: pyrroline-5-carboxylate reductase [Erysipelotrichaceae bacterium]|nr:pyrroline-5-carboxylate reductase [Erysipelotrichaceae bacterium]